MEEVKRLYRYDYDKAYFYGMANGELICYEFDVIKETPGGYWLVNHVEEDSLTRGRLTGKKWISKNAGKKWAHKTKEEALKAYIIRKQYQLKMVKREVDSVDLALRLGEILLEESKNKIIS